MTVIPFKRPEQKKTAPPVQTRRSLGEFAGAMALTGLVFFLLPMLWSGFSMQLLTVVHLLIAVVYFQQGPRIAAAVWIALTLLTLVITSAPSPVTYALWRGQVALDAGLAPAAPK
ncbi:hypothetical protein [Methylopila sp. M107]|uniref:hypothetical protein n=1 Tax=Methylopila sp. M107 TaxID=1101190 RepID=UPI000370347A|nr:hypothetical protein [Methylopila sp. M107]